MNTQQNIKLLKSYKAPQLRPIQLKLENFLALSIKEGDLGEEATRKNVFQYYSYEE